MVKVYNKKTDKDIPPNAVYVGRPSKWGNPYKIGWQKHQVYWNRDDVILIYRKCLPDSALMKDINELYGKDLVCWCAPLPCHADVLLELANREAKDV